MGPWARDRRDRGTGRAGTWAGAGQGRAHVADLEQIAGVYLGPGRPRRGELRQKEALLLLTTQDLDSIAVQRPHSDRRTITAQLAVLPRDCADSVELEINPANRLEARARGERWEEHQPPLTATADFLQREHFLQFVELGTQEVLAWRGSGPIGGIKTDGTRPRQHGSGDKQGKKRTRAAGRG